MVKPPGATVTCTVLAGVVDRLSNRAAPSYTSITAGPPPGIRTTVCATLLSAPGLPTADLSGIERTLNVHQDGLEGRG
jgi:hypothetical protein